MEKKTKRTTKSNLLPNKGVLGKQKLKLQKIYEALEVCKRHTAILHEPRTENN